MEWDDTEKEKLNKFIRELLYDRMSIDDYYLVMDELGVKHRGSSFQTCCHNAEPNDGGFNLSFYEDERSFYCFSRCCCSFSLLSLIKKNRKLNGLDGRTVSSLKWLCNVLEIECNFKSEDIGDISNRYNWNYLNQYTDKGKINELKVYDEDVLYNLEDCVYEPWVEEGITPKIQKKYGVKWYGRKQQVVVPIRNEDGEFVGTHCRNTNPSVIEDGMKYDHLRLLNGAEYKFQMGLVLFGLNMNKVNIEKSKSVIIFESMKSVMMMDSILEHNISVGIFGINLQLSKLKILLTYGVTRFIIALDRQYESVYDDNGEYTKEFISYKEHIDNIIDFLKPYAETIEIVWDTDENRLLGYKDAPCDKGKEVWEELYKNREVAYEREEQN